MSADLQKTKSGMVSGVLLLVLIISLMGLAILKVTGFIENNMAQQGVGVVLGGMLILLGNYMPKLVLPLGILGDNAPKLNKLERIAGNAFVLTGGLVVSVWVLAPQDIRMLLSAILVLVVFALLASVWSRSLFGGLSEKKLEAKLAGVDIQVRSNQRLAVFGFLYVILWVFAIFLADAVWGDRVSQGMVLPFIIISAVVISFVTIKHQLKR